MRLLKNIFIMLNLVFIISCEPTTTKKNSDSMTVQEPITSIERTVLTDSSKYEITWSESFPIYKVKKDGKVIHSTRVRNIESFEVEASGDKIKVKKNGEERIFE